METSLVTLRDRWQRRRWRPNEGALALFAHLTPVVVITGASEGIGLAFARRFVAEGQHVLLIARSAERLEKAAAELNKTAATAAGGRVSTLALDIAAANALPALDAKLAEIKAYADILVNNAGVGLSGQFVRSTPEALTDLVNINITALTRLSRHVLPGQMIRGRGGIINVASLGGFGPGPYQAAYYASKAYVISLSEALAVETAGHGVRVTCVAPGPVDTDFHAKMGSLTAWYRRLIPNQTADQVARRGMAGYRWGARVIVPSLLTTAMMIGMRIFPHRLTVPIIRRLLRAR